MTTLLPRRVSENIDRFTGREWLLPKFLEWWDRGEERLYLLTGPPGSGKSMILAWLAGFGPTADDPAVRTQLARVREMVKAAHFCQASSRNISPQAFVDSVAHQLTGTVKAFGDALAATLAERVQIVANVHAGTVALGASVTGNKIEHIDLGTLGDEFSFDRAFTWPLKKLYEKGHTGSILILIDGLDEALGYTGDKTLPALLSTLEDLPPQVRILATSRDEPRVRKFFRGTKPFDLLKDASLNVDDVRTYAEGRLSKLAAVEAIKRRDFAQRVATRADGVFLYAALVLDDLLERLPSVLPDLDAYPLPEGLSALYHAFLTRELGRDDQLWSDRFRPLLGLIAVAQGEGLTASQLKGIAAHGMDEIGDTLRKCKQYLAGDLPDGPFRPFHKSFADFLFDEEDNADYHIDPTGMHGQIAGHYTPDVAAHRLDDYGLRYIISHLLGSRRLAAAYEVMLDFGYLEDRCIRSNVDELLGDFNAVLGASVPGPKTDDLHALCRFLRAEAAFLKHNPKALFQQAINQPAESSVYRLALAEGGNRDARRSLLRWINKPAEVDPCLAVLVGHEAWLIQCGWLQATGAIVSADDDGTFKLWDALRAQSVETHSRHGSTVLAWSYDGESYLADVGHSLIIADTRSGAARHRLDLISLGMAADRRKWSGGKVGCCAWSHDNGAVIWSTESGALRIWDIVGGQSRTIREAGGGSCCSLSPDTSRAVIGTNPPIILELATGRELGTLGEARTVVEGNIHRWTVFSGHRAGVCACAWSPDGKRIATAGGHGFGMDDDDFSVRVWDAATLCEVACMIGHADRVVSCQWSADGQRLATTSGSVMTPGKDNSLRIWDATNFRPLAKFTGHTNEVVNGAWSSDGTRIVSASKDRTLRLWDATSQAEAETAAQLIAISPDGQKAAAALVDHSIAIIDVASGKREGRLAGHSDDLCALAWASDGRRLASGGTDRTLRLWDARDLRELAVCVGDKGETTYTAGGHRIEWGSVIDCAWSPDDARVVSASNDGRLSVWDPVDGSKLRTLQGHTAPVRACAWSFDGRCVISYGGSFEHLSDRSIRVWDALYGTELGTVSDDDASALRDGILRDTTRVRDVGLQFFRGQQSLDDTTTSLALTCSSDASKAAVWLGSFVWKHSPAPIAVFDLSNGGIRAELHGHSDSVLQCVWCPDGIHLASASKDGTIRLWDTERVELLAVFPMRSLVRKLSFGLSGRAIVALDDGGHIYVLGIEGAVTGPPVVPPAFRYRYCLKSWDSEPVARCGVCGVDSPVAHYRVSKSADEKLLKIPVCLCPLCGNKNRVIEDLTDRRSQHERLEPYQTESGEAWIRMATGLFVNDSDYRYAAHAIAQALMLDTRKTLTWPWSERVAWREIARLLRDHGEETAAIEADRRAKRRGAKRKEPRQD